MSFSSALEKNRAAFVRLFGVSAPPEPVSQEPAEPPKGDDPALERYSLFARGFEPAISPGPIEYPALPPEQPRQPPDPVDALYYRLVLDARHLPQQEEEF